MMRTVSTGNVVCVGRGVKTLLLSPGWSNTISKHELFFLFYPTAWRLETDSSLSPFLLSLSLTWWVAGCQWTHPWTLRISALKRFVYAPQLPRFSFPLTTLAPLESEVSPSHRHQASLVSFDPPAHHPSTGSCSRPSPFLPPTPQPSHPPADGLTQPTRLHPSDDGWRRGGRAIHAGGMAAGYMCVRLARPPRAPASLALDPFLLLTCVCVCVCVCGGQTDRQCVREREREGRERER